MEALTPSCRPVCGELGHSYVQLMGWRCHHHGALSLTLRVWQDTPDGAEQLYEENLALGPFDSAADADDLVRAFQAAVGGLMGDRGSL